MYYTILNSSGKLQSYSKIWWQQKELKENRFLYVQECDVPWRIWTKLGWTKLKTENTDHINNKILRKQVSQTETGDRRTKRSMQCIHNCVLHSVNYQQTLTEITSITASPPHGVQTHYKWWVLEIQWLCQLKCWVTGQLSKNLHCNLLYYNWSPGRGRRGLNTAGSHSMHIRSVVDTTLVQQVMGSGLDAVFLVLWLTVMWQ